MKSFKEVEELVNETISTCDIVGILKEVSTEARRVLDGEEEVEGKKVILGRALNAETDFYTVLVKGRVIIRDYKHLDKKPHQNFIEVYENGAIVFEYKNIIITMKQIAEEQ